MIEPDRPDPLKVDDEGYYVPWWYVALAFAVCSFAAFIALLVGP